MRAEIAECYGWTFEYIDGLPWDMIASARRGTKKPQSGVSFSSDEELQEINRNWWKYVRGLEGLE